VDHVDEESPRTMAKKGKTDYALSARSSTAKMTAPDLPYQPRDPKRYAPHIGVIGCGGISTVHLKAYKRAGYNVAAVCDIDESKAEAQRAAFYRRADVYTRYQDLLAREDIAVVDITAHPAERAPIIEAALKAGKHVLSQKPFVLDLGVGERLVKLARDRGLKLAVNQNGRWAPHFSYMREAIRAGLIGDVTTVDFSLHWDHNWTKDTVFNKVHHLVLYDFAIHWFDIATAFLGGRAAKRVYASVAKSTSQQATPPLLAHVCAEYDHGQATFVFNADTQFGHEDRTTIVGTKGTLRGVGPIIEHQKVTLYTAKGIATPRLKGKWFPDGFHGTMGELLCAIEQNREPINGAAENLKSIALCFAAVASADTGKPTVPGKVPRIGTR
jgi:predicted dehydrogenase